ncbi:MAG: UDP-3-O-acyl-N-acetylglucosamine deacetylase [Candidatus Nitrospinota bacterium M3_3B_026]
MRKGRIIVVDDEENIRTALKEILTDEGYQVSLAADGETALRMIQSDAPDLVLLDIWVPGIDGIQTLKILKKLDAGAEVVMMSGHGTIETAVKATKFGAFDFIEKPFSLDVILRTVAAALRNRKARVAANRGDLASTVEKQFIGSSREAKKARRMFRKAAGEPGPILVVGEPGLGKKFAARMIHNLSERRDRPFIEISCEVMAREGVEATLLEEDAGDMSKFELAEGGTIFFDKLEKLPAVAQKRLVEILTREAKNGEGAEPGAVIIASMDMAGTPRGAPAKNGALSEPLAALFPGPVIKLPPLRERREDIPDYVEQFMEEMLEEFGRSIESVDEEALEILTEAEWPENVRQLKSVLEQGVLACDGPVLTKDHIPTAELKPPARKKRSKRKRKTGSAQLPLVSSGGAGGIPQRTLKNSMVLCGHGLHSGIKTGLILSPLPPDSGIIFGDISTGAHVPALLENVRSTEYATTLSNGSVTIKTIEHIMSAMASYRITNALIKIGDEAPIMDGSALDFCQIIENSEIVEQDGAVEEIVITERISVGDPEEGPYLAVEPSDGFSVDYYLDYPPPIGRQRYEYIYESGERYKETIAPARTFGFLKDIKKLEEAGLASGGKLSNVILIDDEKVVNTPLRFPDEPARHKILDLIGDLYLLGRPIRGRFIARKSGHTQNIALIRKIKEREERKTSGKSRARSHAAG